MFSTLKFELKIEDDDIVDFFVETINLMEIRGSVGNCNGVKFVIHSNESNHSIPHVHAEYGEYGISIAIMDGTILAGNLPQRNQRTAVDWVIKHRDELLGKWNTLSIHGISKLTKSML